MQMGLAHDYGAGLSQARSYGGVSRSDAILFCIEMGPASGGVARDIEAIFNPDRDAKERRPPRRVREARGRASASASTRSRSNARYTFRPTLLLARASASCACKTGSLRRQGCLQRRERHIDLCIPRSACTRPSENDLNCRHER